MHNNTINANRVVHRDTRELNVVCTVDALNLVRKHLFRALRSIDLDASCIVVSRSNTQPHASMDATVRCRRPGDDAKLRAIAETLRRQDGVSGASWRSPFPPALAA